MITVWLVMHTSTESIMAITEEEDHGHRYMKLKKFGDTYSYFFLKGFAAEQILQDYDDLYLEHDLATDFIMTRAEMKMVAEIVGTHTSRMVDSIQALNLLAVGLEWSREERKSLRKAVHILQKGLKPRRLRDLLGIKTWLSYLGKGSSDSDMYQKNVENATDRIRVWFSK